MKRFQNGQITFILSKKLHQCLGRIKQTFIHLNGRGGDKHDALLNVLKTYKDRRWIVFCNTIASCRSTDHFLIEQGFSCSCYHGGIPPKMREANWKMFLSNERSILICTDIGSRGLDTTMVEHVILFDFPLSPLDYLHRIGRTARAGKPGRATSLVTKRDRILAAAIQTANRKGIALDKLSSNRKDYEVGNLKGLLGKCTSDLIHRKSRKSSKSDNDLDAKSSQIPKKPISLNKSLASS